MSSKRGSGETRNRPQKYKNSFAFKNNLHDKTPQQKRINLINVREVCERCKDQIEWKIKYKKYKALSQAKTCIKCSQRTVKKAYHVVCTDCAKKERICAKCLKSADQVTIQPPEPSQSEQQRLKTEMDRLVKLLPERKRRTFMRYMKKGKEVENDKSETGESNEKVDGNEEELPAKTRVPHSREELLTKIDNLKLNDGDDSDIDDDILNSESDYDHDFDSDDLDSDDDSDPQ